MSDYDSLNHSTWECKYHIVWIPKYRRKKAVCNHTRELRAGNPDTGSLPRMQGAGRAYDDRPRAYDHRGAFEIFHCTGDGVYQGEKCGIRSTKVWR